MTEKILERLGELIEKSFDDSLKGNPFACARNGAYHEAKEIVQEVAKEYGKDTNVRSNGWIPVEERLPELCKEVLVTQIFDNGNCNVTNASLIPMLDGSERVKWCSYDHFISCVEAWQPLPAPYQKGE